MFDLATITENRDVTQRRAIAKAITLLESTRAVPGRKVVVLT